MANTIVQPSVKFSVRYYHYRTHKPDGLIKKGPFRLASKAADAFAKHVALDFTYRYPAPPKKVKKSTNSKQIVITMVYDDPLWNTSYQKAYRRSLKIFKAMGMK